MSYQPQIPLAGIGGWRFLQRTETTQRAAFENGAQLRREIAYFEENIGSVTSAAELVGNRRLLGVALGAFGLEDEIDKRAFIRKVLEEDALDPSSLANRLSNPAYKKLADAFGFGELSGARTGDAAAMQKVVDAYRTRAFEVAVGETDNNMRLAMNFEREIVELAAGDGKSWFAVLGSTPLRKVVEKAFGLPSQFVNVDIDRQAKILREKAQRLFGSDSLTVFQDPANVEKMITRFLARAQIEEGVGGTSAASNALILLQSANGGGSKGLYNLLYGA
jgi:hypothetical protein